jgi:hypothetical protein
MQLNNRRGVAIVEFSFVMVVLIPLLLGTTAFGIRLIQAQRTVQLSRDAARMYAHGLDFGQPGNKTILADLGADIGLQTDGTGNSVLILSTVTYVDKGLCQSTGHGVDASGDPIGCTNWKYWVFRQRVTVGNSSIRTSNLGSPLLAGSGHVSVDPTTDQYTLTDQTDNINDRATFVQGNPFVNMGGALNTLPSGQELYVSEVAVVGFKMPPFANGDMVYSYNVF